MSATGKLEIVRANYGAGDKTADLTEKIRAAAVGGVLNVRAENSLADKDPAPNIKKTLVVDYLLNGVRGTTTTPEGETLSAFGLLNCPSRSRLDLFASAPRNQAA